MMALRIAALVYVGLCIVLAVFQTAIIFPGAATQGRADCVVRPFQGSELVELKTTDGEKVVALFGPAMTATGTAHPDAKNRPTLLYFYGNGMCMADCEGEFLKFRQRGFNVMIPDFLGYGMSGGKPSEAACYATADAAYEHLRTRKDIDPNRIIASGWSLGGAVAVDLASRKKVVALAIFSTFTRLADAAREHMPYVPASLLLRHRFDSLKKIPQVTCATLIGHGRRDPIIPFAMSERLAEAAGGPVLRLVVEDAGHNDFFVIGAPKIHGALKQLIDELPEPPPMPPGR